MTEFLSGQDVLNGVAKLKKSLHSDKELLATLCQGKTECEKNLSQVLTLTSAGQAAAKATEEKIIKKLESEMSEKPIKKIDEATFQLEKSVRDMAAQVNACRQTEESLKPEDWNIKSCILLYYPFKNEYTYADGYKVLKKQATHTNCADEKGIKDVIKRALTMGIDPLTFLSLGLMEGGSNGWTGLYLDPIGVVKALGCKENQTDITQYGANKLSSFGNYHSISPGVIENKDLTDRLKNYMTTGGAVISEGQKYVCADLKGGEMQVLSSAPADQWTAPLNLDKFT